MRKLLSLSFSLLMALSALAMVGNPAQATTASLCGTIGVSGTHITIDGTNQASTFQGFNDGTVLPFAIQAYVNGLTTFYGCDQVFPYPTGSPPAGQPIQAKIPGITNLSMAWYTYFWLCDHYNMHLVRLGAGDSWATQIIYSAWLNHTTAFYQCLDEMTKWADNFGVYIILDLAGGEPYTFAFQAAGNQLVPGDPAYLNMMTYEKNVISHFNASAHNNAIFAFDAYNEPDADVLNTWYWNYWQALFNTWAKGVAQNLTPWSSHLIELGEASGGALFYYTQASFNLATGTTGFDVCDVHRYGAAGNNLSSTFTNLNTWANAINKPLIYSELGFIQSGKTIRWTYAEAQIDSHNTGAWITMSLAGTASYPYTGSYPTYPNMPSIWPVVFTSSGVVTGTENAFYTYTITTNATSTLSLVSSSAFLNLALNVLSGTPMTGDIGSHAIVIKAVSSSGGISYQNFTIVVSAAYVPTPIIPIVIPANLGYIAPLVGLLLLIIAPTGMAISYRNDEPKHVVLWVLLMVIILVFFAWSIGAI